MLKTALALIIASAVVALIALVPALGFGGRLVPGYAFKAKGKKAREQELFLLRRIAMMIYSLAVLLSGAGVTVYFGKDSRELVIIYCCLAAAIIAFWAVYILIGKLKKAAVAAKELSEEE
ncbi:MAG: hypothetical protein IKC36_05910 [Clostridia bacterium]|nr:hypothetical protein [Clostridia bacterium]